MDCRHSRAFTLIELLVVMAVIALLATLVGPRYISGLDRSRDAVLKQDLATMRGAIDKYYGDRGYYPASLAELVERKYLSRVPRDPMTESDATWIMVPPVPPLKGAVYEVRSGAPGVGRDGRPYQEW